MAVGINGMGRIGRLALRAAMGGLPRDPSDPLALLAAAGDLTVSHLGLGEEGMVLVHRPNPEQRLLLPGVDLPALANLLRESYHRLNEHMDFLKTPVAAVTN